MSLADCGQCWSHPCTCGHAYEGQSDAWIYRLIVQLIRIMTLRHHIPLATVVDSIVKASHKDGIF